MKKDTTRNRIKKFRRGKSSFRNIFNFNTPYKQAKAEFRKQKKAVLKKGSKDLDKSIAKIKNKPLRTFLQSSRAIGPEYSKAKRELFKYSPYRLKNQLSVRGLLRYIEGRRVLKEKLQAKAKKQARTLLSQKIRKAQIKSLAKIKKLEKAQIKKEIKWKEEAGILHFEEEAQVLGKHSSLITEEYKNHLRERIEDGDSFTEGDEEDEDLVNDFKYSGGTYEEFKATLGQELPEAVGPYWADQIIDVLLALF